MFIQQSKPNCFRSDLKTAVTTANSIATLWSFLANDLQRDAAVIEHFALTKCAEEKETETPKADWRNKNIEKILDLMFDKVDSIAKQTQALKEKDNANKSE